MPLIPAAMECGSTLRTNLSYAVYGRATWEWWCKRHGVEFVVLDKPIGDGVFADMSPSFRRWLALERLLDEYGPGARVAFVDADTMIRWDTPDFFALAGDAFAAVRDLNPRWVLHDIKAYQPLFPQVQLPWWDYFNCGIVVLGDAQLPVVMSFLDFIERRWPELDAVQKSDKVGADQTPLNLFVRGAGEHVEFLPAPFNLLGCPASGKLVEMERNGHPDEDFVAVLRDNPDIFSFLEYGYVWHFTSLVTARRVVMSETWRLVAHNYPGAALPVHGHPQAVGVSHVPLTR